MQRTRDARDRVAFPLPVFSPLGASVGHVRCLGLTSARRLASAGRRAGRFLFALHTIEGAESGRFGQPARGRRPVTCGESFRPTSFFPMHAPAVGVGQNTGCPRRRGAHGTCQWVRRTVKRDEPSTRGPHEGTDARLAASVTRDPDFFEAARQRPRLSPGSNASRSFGASSRRSKTFRLVSGREGTVNTGVAELRGRDVRRVTGASRGPAISHKATARESARAAAVSTGTALLLLPPFPPCRQTPARRHFPRTARRFGAGAER